MAGNKRQTTRIKWQLLLIFIVAFSIRLAMNIIFQGLNSPPDPDMGSDHIDYDLLAQNLAMGKGFSYGNGPETYRPPGVSFLMAAIYVFFGVNYAVVRIVFSLIGALNCIILYFIGREVINKKVGLASAVVLAIYPMHFYYSSHFYPEVPWAFFMSLCVLCALLLQRKEKIVYGILMGFFLGFSAYIRPIALFYPIFFIILSFPSYFSINRKKCLILCFIPLITMMLFIGPWIVRNYKVTKHFVLISTHGGAAFWSAHNEKILNDPKIIGSWITTIGLPERNEFDKIKGEYQKDKAAYGYGWAFVKRHLRDMPKLEIMKIYRLITPFYETPNRLFNLIGGGSWGFLMPFVFIGMIRTVKNKMFISIHSTALLLIFITLVFYGSNRFGVSISPFLVLYSCIGFFMAWESIKHFPNH